MSKFREVLWILRDYWKVCCNYQIETSVHQRMVNILPNKENGEDSVHQRNGEDRQEDGALAG